MSRTIYFDHAATGYPKSPAVVRAVQNALTGSLGNPGRGSHHLAARAASLLYDAREMAGALFYADPACVAFTMNATQALNCAIKGLTRDGGHILIDSFAHNAAYRPALSLRQRGCMVEVYDAHENDAKILADLEHRLRADTTLVIATHQSNVCSKILPIAAIGDLCRRHAIPFVVDASQSAGHLPIDATSMHITALCMPGHKGLGGPMGCGMLISSPDAQYQTILEGGAGIRSLDEAMPDTLPERLEAGTVALPAIAGLLAGLRQIEREGIGGIHEAERNLAAHFCTRSAEIPAMHLIGETDGAVISFVHASVSPSEIGRILDRHGISVRCGYHCAPLAHATLGTLENGTVRVSFAPTNTTAEIDRFFTVLRQELC